MIRYDQGCYWLTGTYRHLHKYLHVSLWLKHQWFSHKIHLMTKSRSETIDDTALELYAYDKNSRTAKSAGKQFITTVDCHCACCLIMVRISGQIVV